jgi:hypothetical protein
MYIAAEILELCGTAARERHSRIINQADVEVNTRVVAHDPFSVTHSYATCL